MQPATQSLPFRRTPPPGRLPDQPNRPAPILISLLHLILPILICAPAFPQGPSATDFNPLSTNSSGVHLYSVYGYTGYFSTPMVYNGGASGLPLGPDMGFGGGASIGWNYLKSGSGISVLYSPSYNGFVQYSKLNSFNHALSITIHKGHKEGTKWQTNFSVVTAYQTVTQFLFSPTGLAQVASASTTFDDLANGIVAGRLSDNQLASLLTGASLPNSAAELALYGDRAFDAAIQAGVSYAYSSRLSIHAALSGSRFQALPSSTSGTAPNLFSSTTSATGTLGISYSLSPRTQIGAEASTSRIFSPFEDIYTTSGTLTFGRIMSRRWFTQLRAGVSFITPVRLVAQLYQGPQVVGGGNLGYKTLSHTFLLSYDRMRSDAYGLGSQSTSSADAAWNWRPGGGWLASVSAGYLQMNGGVFGRATSWIGHANLSKMLTRQVGVKFDFSYVSNKGAFAAALPNPNLYGVVMSVFWMPGGEAARKPSN